MNAQVEQIQLSDRIGPTNHAFYERYLIHFPEATQEEFIADVRSGTPLSYDLVQALTQRVAPDPEYFKLARDNKSPRVRSRRSDGIRRLKPEWCQAIVEQEGDFVPDPNATFILSVHRKGIFVIENEHHESVITYLRLTDAAQKVVADL
jgi:hypothetical protein